jgi:hypothetical protein
MAVADKRVSAADFADRCREREERSAADTRTMLEKLLGDPPRDRSALAASSRSDVEP